MEYLLVRQLLEEGIKNKETEAILEGFKQLDELFNSDNKKKHCHDHIRLLFENLNDAFAHFEIITDDQDTPIDFRYIEINAAFEKFIDRKREDIIGKKASEVSQMLINNWIDKCGNVALTGKSIEFTNYIAKYEKYYDVKAYAPKIGFFAVILTEITQQVKAEQALKESEERFRMLAENSTDFISLQNMSGKLIYASPSVKTMLGYESSEIIGTNPLDYFHPDDIPKFKPLFEDLLKNKTGTSAQLRFKHKNGHYIWLESIAKIFINEHEREPLIISTHRDISGQKNALLALKEKEEKYRFLTENILDVIWVMDVTAMKITYISPSVEKLTGYSANEIISRPISEIFSPTSFEKLNEQLAYRMQLFIDDPKSSEIYVDELEQPIKNGGTKFTEVISYFRQNAENKNIEVICTSRDITDRKNAQLVLKRVRERLKILTDLTIEGLIIHDNGEIIDINPAVERMFGIDLNALKDKSIFNFIHPDYHEIVKSKTENKITDRYEVVLVRPDGSDFPAEIETKNITLKSKPFRVVVIRDISERKKAEEKINKFSSAITQSPAAIVITNTSGNIEYVNPQFTVITGYSPEEAYGQNPNILKSGLTPPDVYKELWTTISAGNTWKGEILNKRKDGTLFWESAIIAPIKNEKEKIISYIAVKEDITSKKEAEDALIRSQESLKQANATKDKFFSIIAHDLKNPFNIILGFSDLLLQNYKEYDNDTRASVIKTIYDISLKTFNLLENLLAWSRTQTGIISFNPKNIDLRTLTDDCMSLFKENAEKKKIKLVSKVPDELVVFADRDMIATVIRNLIVNGIKFTPREGKVTVKAAKIEDNLIQIEVKDTGVGINPNKLNIIFNVDRDWSELGTEEETGTGLGLFLCKEFVEKNGGKIWVKSEISVGTSFYFTLPVNV